MNDTKDLAAKICMDGLKEIVLNVLAEVKETEDLGPTEIGIRTGIIDQLSDLKDRSWATNFINILLRAMQDAELVKNHGPKGKPSWKITAKGLEKLQETS